MSIKKIIFFCSLAVALSALIFLSVYFLTMKPSANVPSNQPEQTTSTQVSVDTSEWKTFSDKELKISFDYPQEWGQYKKRSGAVFEDMAGFYRSTEILGDVFFEGANVSLDIVSFHATGSLAEVNLMSDTGAMFDSHVFGDNPKEEIIAGLSGYRLKQEYSSQMDEASGYQIADQVLLKRGDDYFFLVFGIKRGIQNEQEIINIQREWNGVLSSLRPL